MRVMLSSILLVGFTMSLCWAQIEESEFDSAVQAVAQATQQGNDRDERGGQRRSRLDAVFQRLDADGDGSLSKEEFGTMIAIGPDIAIGRSRIGSSRGEWLGRSVVPSVPVLAGGTAAAVHPVLRVALDLAVKK